MESISKITETLNKLYGFNVMTKSRARRFAYGRKVLTCLLSNHGHTNGSIKSELGIPHHQIIYNHTTMCVLNKIDMFNYNRCIDELDLKLKKILTLSSLSSNPVAEDMFEQMKTLSRKDLMHFKSQIFDPYYSEVSLRNSLRGLD